MKQAPVLSAQTAAYDLPERADPSRQYDLFTTFFGDRSELSNSIELWDAIPKYAISARKQASLRDEKGRLPVHRQDFQYRANGSDRAATISMRLQPATISVDGVDRDFYPSANEELLEEVLRKIFCDQQYGIHDVKDYASWVKFTLYMVRKELKERGHTRSHDEVRQSLEILTRCHIEVTMQGHKKALYSASALPELMCNGRDDYLADPKSKWAARFPALISRSINQIDYRQFNYGKLMQLPTPLARWMHKRLSHNYTNANIRHPYHILYSTIERDSGMLQHVKPDRNLKTVDQMWETLKDAGVIMWVKRIDGAGPDHSDIRYEVIPTDQFTKDIMAANARQRDHRAQLGDVDAKMRIASKKTKQEQQDAQARLRTYLNAE